MIQFNSTHNGIFHLMRVVIGKSETVAAAVEFVVRLYRIEQTARFSNDGHGSVAGRYHLRKTARFRKRRHKEDVRTGIDKF